MKTPRTLLTIIAATGLTLNGCGKNDLPHNNAIGHNNSATINYHFHGPATINALPPGSASSGSAGNAALGGPCSGYYQHKVHRLPLLFEDKKTYKAFSEALNDILMMEISGSPSDYDLMRVTEQFTEALNQGQIGGVNGKKCQEGTYVITQSQVLALMRDGREWIRANGGGKSQGLLDQEARRNARQSQYGDWLGRGSTPGGTVREYHQRRSQALGGGPVESGASDGSGLTQNYLRALEEIRSRHEQEGRSLLPAGLVEQENRQGERPQKRAYGDWLGRRFTPGGDVRSHNARNAASYYNRGNR